MKWADAYLGLKISLKNTEVVYSCFFLRLVRNHLMDMLWGYALVFALFFLCDRNSCKDAHSHEKDVNKTVTSDLRKIFAISGIFSAMLETCQLLPGVQGTFDLWDILLELLAELLAVFMIKNYYVAFVEEEKK